MVSQRSQDPRKLRHDSQAPKPHGTGIFSGRQSGQILLETLVVAGVFFSLLLITHFAVLESKKSLKRPYQKAGTRFQRGPQNGR